jgi:hypothetical protein
VTLHRTEKDTAVARYRALQRLARTQQRPTAELLQLYVLEGFLRRVAGSAFRDRFVLKGGVLMAAFGLRRPTRDLDFLALRVDNEPAVVEQRIVEVASTRVDDGIVFRTETVATSRIRDDDVYPGIRATLDATLASARVKLSVDVNVGDPVVPSAIAAQVPALLGEERIEVLAYPKAMVVAEKLVTALQRGRASTRWRDFADLLLLTSSSGNEAETIHALRAVAVHRRVALQPLSVVLEGMHEEAQARWALWRERQAGKDRLPTEFAAVIELLDVRTRPWLTAGTPSAP